MTCGAKPRADGLEAGVPLHHVRDLLGHADISTTSRYLSVTPTELQRSMRHVEETRSKKQAG
jgi:site-specific recombinase XerD